MNNGLKLGELITELKKLPKKSIIDFDFGGCVPTSPDSYRGYYDQLALGFSGEYGTELLTVGKLLNSLEQAIGHTYQGWKGGDYTMHKDTYVFVANPGNTSDTYIKAIKQKYDDWYTLVTEEEQDD